MCQIGLVQVRGGRIIGEWESLLQPPAGHGWVDYGRGQIHGLTTRLLSTQPAFDTVWPQVLRRLEGQVLAARVRAGTLVDLLAASGVSLGRAGFERQQTCHAIGSGPIQSLDLEPRLF